MKKIIFTFVGFALAWNTFGAPKVEFNLDDPSEQKLGRNRLTDEEDPGFFVKAGKTILDSLDGPVVKLNKYREAPANKYAFQPKNELLREILKYYQRSQVPEEGLKHLSIRGSTVDKQLRFYRKYPQRLPKDIYRRIQYARTHKKGLASLEDVFVLQNAYRSTGVDIVEKLVHHHDWLNFVHAPLGSSPPFPIHMVTIFKDTMSNMSLSRRVDMLPTTVRWAQHFQNPNFLVRQPSSGVSKAHRHCLRVPSGQFAGQYHAMKFGGPHVEGHPDVHWWTGIFHQRALRPRRVAVLVSVGSEMKDSDSQRGRGYRSCMRFRSLENLIHARWEGMSYALIPFSSGVLGLEQGEHPPFFQWKQHRKEMLSELRQWGCAYRTKRSSTDWNQKKIISQLQRQVFSGTYQYGDSVIVLLSRLDPHYAQWSNLSKQSEGLQAFASSSGILIAMDMALRAK